MKSICHSCHIFIKLDFSRQIFEKTFPNIKCNENPSNGSRVVPRGQVNGRTDFTMQIVAFQDSAYASKNERLVVEELKTNLMSLVIFISLIICSTCFGH